MLVMTQRKDHGMFYGMRLLLSQKLNENNAQTQVYQQKNLEQSVLKDLFAFKTCSIHEYSMLQIHSK